MYHIERLMFPLDSTDIAFQTWVDYAAWRAASCVDFFIIRELIQAFMPRYLPEINILFWLSVGYLFDYFVIYNNPFAKIWIIPISYTSFMLILGVITLINAMRKSWT